MKGSVTGHLEAFGYDITERVNFLFTEHFLFTSPTNPDGVPACRQNPRAYYPKDVGPAHPVSPMTNGQ
ncbi:hypothetical protein HX857_32690 [Pseudomonas gingeri]|uniref:hypothetical protein n=1 Tax=Pseudomonas gingeri TaxID=117681 RepID=UPI0015BC6A69|nr:hypothetical protein [Pseudomonas gingeri]NWE73477.1 hypothetical protein [Pseudomonas gingeri]